MKKAGDLGVSIERMKNDLTETEEAQIADQEFLANLDKSCKSKAAEWEERSKTRAEEQLALADTIKILNEDDALELFKKTLPSKGSSFVQVPTTTATLKQRALREIEEATVQHGQGSRLRTNLIALALRGKKVGLSKVIKMIDEMVVLLKEEQLDDDHKKEYCDKQFDQSDDKKKQLERAVADTQAAIETAKESILTTTDEIDALEDGITALDKEVAEATENRKEENKDYTELMASNTAAKELLNLAKNRLNKFYNPKMHKPDTEDAQPAMLAEISAHNAAKVAPPPPPETFGAYSKKTEESGGVVSMINLLVADLEKEMTEAETSEKEGQQEYETLMKDSAAKRKKDSETVTSKKSVKADLKAELEEQMDTKASTQRDLAALKDYIHQLHGECDFLIKYYDARKEARSSEIDSLEKAKGVLTGADFSLLQKEGGRRYLRRAV